MGGFGGGLRFRETVVHESEGVEPLQWLPKGHSWHCLLVGCLGGNATQRQIEVGEEEVEGGGDACRPNRSRGCDNLVGIHVGARIGAFPVAL